MSEVGPNRAAYLAMLAEIQESSRRLNDELDEALARPSLRDEWAQQDRVYELRRRGLHLRLVGPDGTIPEPEPEPERLAEVIPFRKPQS